MKSISLFILFFVSCCSFMSHAKSPCYTLASNAFFNSSLSPTKATRQNLQDANEIMTDAETFCKRMVQAVKTNKISAQAMRLGADEKLNAAKHDFELDGDMDKLEFAKFMSTVLKGSADIAER